MLLFWVPRDPGTGNICNASEVATVRAPPAIIAEMESAWGRKPSRKRSAKLVFQMSVIMHC